MNKYREYIQGIYSRQDNKRIIISLSRSPVSNVGTPGMITYNRRGYNVYRLCTDPLDKSTYQISKVKAYRF